MRRRVSHCPTNWWAFLLLPRSETLYHSTWKSMQTILRQTESEYRLCAGCTILCTFMQYSIRFAVFRDSATRTNTYECQEINIIAGRRRHPLSTAERRKLEWFGHVCRHDSLPKITLQGTADDKMICHPRGRPRKSWRDNIKEWTGQSLSSLLRIADDLKRRLDVTGVSLLVISLVKGQPTPICNLLCVRSTIPVPTNSA